MRTLAAIYRDIVADPDSDRLRLEYADACETSDPVRARYIRWHLAHEHARITGDLPSWAGGEYAGSPRIADQSRLEAEWAADLVPYLYAPTSFRYHRGFVTYVQLSAATFLERGAEVFERAPLRHLALGVKAPIVDHVPQRTPFPMAEVMASPLLARLHGLGFVGIWIELADVEAIAASPHLGRLLSLELENLRNRSSVPARAWDVLASSASIRRLVDLRAEIGGFPGVIAEPVDPPQGTVLHPVTPHGRALEAEHGYIPWLHELHAAAEKFQLAARVAAGQLPRHPAGTPVTEEMYAIEPTDWRSLRRDF